MYLKFWVKTFIYDFFPGGYGYYRYLHEFRDTGYVHDRDKHPVRNKHHGTGGWKEQKKEGPNLWRFLKNKKFPKGYQVLCHNCNHAKSDKPDCPHKSDDSGLMAKFQYA